ncbi:MAG: histidine phosphatase family protein [Nanoarchaeota archaeon]
MKLILVRHGETEENVKKINQGHRPGKLTMLGKEQAVKLAHELKNEKIDVIYCSDLKRTKDTLQPLLQFHKRVPVRYVSEIREKGMGVFEGTERGSIRKHVKKHGHHYPTFRPIFGESFRDVKKRNLRFYKKMLTRHSSQTILWVTHEGVIINLLLYIKGWPDKHYKKLSQENAAVTMVEVNPPNPPIIHSKQ